MPDIIQLALLGVLGLAVGFVGGMTLAAATIAGSSPLLELGTSMFVIILAGITAIMASRLVWTLVAAVKKSYETAIHKKKDFE